MPETSKIPFLDLVAPHSELEAELLAVFQKALRTASFVGGAMVAEFERDFAGFCETRHCAGLASGTDAVRFALMAAGVKAGDLVVTVPHTFIATTEAISQTGARPVFVDIDPVTHSMDSAKLREYLERECLVDAQTGRLTDRARRAPVTAVVPVHIYGQCADMDPILDLAQRYKLMVIEDACQAHGAEYFSKKQKRWRKAGSMGHAAAFSFYPGKNLGACGEAGAITTDNDELARQVRQLRDHGQAKKYYHEMEGYNGRLDAIQAGFLSVKLKYLAQWNRQRREIAKRYQEMFSSVEDIVLPREPEWSRPVYHLFVIRVPNRRELQENLSAAEIDSGIHYPVPLHLQKAYQHYGHRKGDFPVTEQVASEILSLPMYPQLAFEQQKRVVEKVIESYAVASQRRT